MTKEELIARIKETAYLEGDFVLRSGKRSKYYLDKYLFETCPDILTALAEEFAATGGQVIEAAKIITEAGASVKKIVCVIDRKQGAEKNITEAGYKFEAILTKDDLGIKDSQCSDTNLRSCNDN